MSFGINGDASVFVGASRNKGSPLVLLLVRLARREMSIAEPDMLLDALPE